MVFFKWFSRILVLFFSVKSAFAAIYDLPKEGSNIIGQPITVTLKKDQSLQFLAQEYDVGYYEVLEANPNINPKYVVPGTEITLPTQYILPDVPREGVLVNLAELRLYYFFPDGTKVMTAPVGIGKAGWETPETVTVIKDKRENPSWVVPESVYQDMLKRGYKIARIWPAGPNNPLGKHAMRLTLQGYDIHGTNRDEGVGRRTSAGCIRMFPQDVAQLYQQVDVGTQVTIINQPVKLGFQGKKVYLQVHYPLKEQAEKWNYNFSSLFDYVLQKQAALSFTMNSMQAKSLIERPTGLVTPIGQIKL